MVGSIERIWHKQGRTLSQTSFPSQIKSNTNIKNKNNINQIQRTHTHTRSASELVQLANGLIPGRNLDLLLLNFKMRTVDLVDIYA